MSDTSLETKVRNICTDLQKPAGSDPRFSSFDAIRANREAFVLRCHETWKRCHEEAVRQLLIFDAFVRREQSHPIGTSAEQWGAYNRALWRKVNDAIVWSLAGTQRHVVKRLCLYRRRSYLEESNAASVMSTIAELNANPMSIGIWNDATSCVDIGDITYVENGMTPHMTFLELKEGHVNEEILDLIRGGTVDFESRLRDFAAKHGKKGIDQLGRVLRQGQISCQAMTLLDEEQGIDPVTGLEMTVIDSKAPVERYDIALNNVLKAALKDGKECLELVGECIWVYVNTDRTVRIPQARGRFMQMLLKRASPPSMKREPWDKDRIVCLNDCFALPMAMPIFLRGLDAEVVASVGYGALMFRVYMYLDWSKFAAIVGEKGGEFVWSSEKDARRARAMKAPVRPPVVNGRVPQVRLGPDIRSVTDPKLVEMYFDGLTPRTVVREIVAVARMLKKGQ